MKKLSLLLIAIIISLTYHSFAQAIQIGWEFDLGPKNSPGSLGISDGNVTLTFDSENYVYDPIVNDNKVQISWWISDFSLVYDGQSFAPDTSRNPDGWLGSITLEQRKDHFGIGEDLNRLSMSLLMDGGGITFLDLLTGYDPNISLFPTFPQADVPTPIGVIPSGVWPNDITTQTADGTTTHNGRIEAWYNVPAPAPLVLLSIGLVGIGIQRIMRVQIK